jgi:hypothetical protein
MWVLTLTFQERRYQRGQARPYHKQQSRSKS